MAEPSDSPGSAEAVIEPDTTDEVPSSEPSASATRARSRWASAELGELLARAWLDGEDGDEAAPNGDGTGTSEAGSTVGAKTGPAANGSGKAMGTGSGDGRSGPEAPPGTGAAGDEPSTAADADAAWPTSGGWDVERMPSEAEGGIVSLLLGDRRPQPPGASASAAVVPSGELAPLRRPTVAAPADGAPAPRLGSLPPAWGLVAAGDVPGTGLARLTEMLDRLPEGPAARVTPDDFELEAPRPAPPAVWFWGDDDIYPGKVTGVPDGARVVGTAGAARSIDERLARRRRRRKD